MTSTELKSAGLSQLSIARIVIEAATPLSLSTGTPDNVFDTALVRDANGLPAIPGTAIAGVLRHLWQRAASSVNTDNLFGFQKSSMGQQSRLQVSWASMLDSSGLPAEGLLLGSEGAKRLADPVYAAAINQISEPVYRDKVRLTHRGAATDTGKFDRAILPAGNRFALELRLWSRADDDQTEWEQLLGLFTHPGFRLGGASRSGLGRIRLCGIHARVFDLTKALDIKDFQSLGRGVADIDGLLPHKTEDNVHNGWLTGRLTLEARGLWRIGQGDHALDNRYDKPADLLPKVEARIQWKDNKASVGPVFALLPGSSLKGALAHRMAFHLRRLTGEWAEEENAEERPEILADMLGVAKDKETEGKAGVLYIDDAFLSTDSVQIARLMHNAIDRFTAGVRDRALFEEESLFGSSIDINITLNLATIAEHEDLLRQSLNEALADLMNGRLALGSRSTTGNGFFKGTLSGPLSDWLSNKQTAQEVA